MVAGRKRSGRRPGSPDTRDEILAAARNVFAENGFERSAIRRIASEANVDPALIHHYFGTKRDLFLACIEAPFDPDDIIPLLDAAGANQFGDQLVRTFITLWDSPTGNRAAAFLRSAINTPQMSSLVEQFVVSQIIDQALGHLDPAIDKRELRGSLVASQLLGLAVTRYFLKLSPLVNTPIDSLVAIYGPTIQHYLTMDLSHTDLSATP